MNARVARGAESVLDRYVGMVEENVIREDPTFAEMAQVAMAAAADPSITETDPVAVVKRLYASLHKSNRSCIRDFVTLLDVLGSDRRWPKAVSRNLGVDVSKAIGAGTDVEEMRERLRGCTDADAQNAVLSS